MKLAQAIREWARRLFSAQAYNERLESREGDRDNPLAVKRGRIRWFR
jgi:hypothetical protein